MSLLSWLLLPIYLGLIPLILVAGMVLAVRRRHHLGARASNQLVAGAGLLLLAHIFTALRPLLRNVIDQQGVFASVADLINGLSLLQLVAQAAGFGLIIAAVFTTARPRSYAADHLLRNGDQDDAAAMPAGNPGPSAPGNSKMAALVAVVVVAAVVVTAAAAWIIRTGQTSDVPPWRIAEEQQAALCLEHYEELNLPVKAKPVERMLLRKDGGWLRLYVSQPDNWVTACQGGPNGPMGNFGTLMEPGPVDKLRFFGGYDSVLKGHLLLGHMPTGATAIEARLANGQIVRGDHDSDIFVIWAPGGISVEGAQVTASTQDGVVIATAAAPTEQD